MQSKTLAQLIADVRYLSDTQALTDRHPDSDLTTRINMAIRALRGLVTANGGSYFLEATTSTTLAGTLVTGEAYSEVPYPPTALQIHGVDVELASGSGIWYRLTPITWVQRRDSLGYWSGAPQFFCVRRIPYATTNVVNAGAIDIFPAGQSGNYKVWFLGEFTDLASNTDVFLGLPDWHEWIIWTVVRDLAARDDDQRETAAIATTKQGEAEQRLLQGIGRVHSAGALRPRRARRVGMGWAR
jgi:hypothetical protein